MFEYKIVRVMTCTLDSEITLNNLAKDGYQIRDDGIIYDHTSGHVTYFILQREINDKENT